MLKDALKNYMDSYIKVYLKECGTYPQVDAEMTEEPSICFFGEKDEDGYIQWNYVEQPAPIDFDKVEQERHVHVCDEVKQLICFLTCRDSWTAVKKGIFPLTLLWRKRRNCFFHQMHFRQQRSIRILSSLAGMER